MIYRDTFSKRGWRCVQCYAAPTFCRLGLFKRPMTGEVLRSHRSKEELWDLLKPYESLILLGNNITYVHCKDEGPCGVRARREEHRGKFDIVEVGRVGDT